MAQIKLEAKTRLVASSQVTAARGEEWWKGLSPKDKAEYLKQHPTSKFKTLIEKQKTAPAPKLKDVYRRGDDFTDEQNDRAKRSALKHIQDTQEKNKKIKEENKGKDAVNRLINKDKRDKVSNAPDVDKHAKSVGDAYGDDLLKDANKHEKKPRTKEQLISELEKSPNWRKNMLAQISMKISPKMKDTTPEERKALKKHLNHLYDVGTKEQQMQFLKKALKG